MTKKPPSRKPTPPRHGVARMISKLGVASRTQAARWVRERRVRVNGRVVCDAEFPVRRGLDRIEIDGEEPAAAARLVLMLNKPRGLVTTASDEQGRDTVYRCLQDAALPWLAPIGRLDKASEGLLLFSNDPVWAAAITDPETGPEKTYHVQVAGLPDASVLAALARGVVLGAERLTVESVRRLRTADKNTWLEIVLAEGRNRQIRRLLEAFDLRVLRLIRVALGALPLGDLPKGRWRMLTEQEIESLSPKLRSRSARCSAQSQTGGSRTSDKPRSENKTRRP
jgi:23S rRNA pseudouridine2605 synthase